MWTCFLVATICSLQLSGAPVCKDPLTSPSSAVTFAETHRETEAEATRPELTSALSRLKVRQKIRVEALNVHPIEGRFLKVVGDTLVVGKEEKDLINPRPVPIDSIQSLQVEKDGKTVGAIMGGVFGGHILRRVGRGGHRFGRPIRIGRERRVGRRRVWSRHRNSGWVSNRLHREALETGIPRAIDSRGATPSRF